MNQFYQVFKSFIVFLLIMGLQTIVTAQCTYTLNMYDSFGDGWNGSILTVTIGGVATDYTIDTGDFGTAAIAIEPNTPMALSYVAGAFQTEVTYELLDNFGNVVFADGPSPMEGLVFSIIPSCGNCTNIPSAELGEITGSSVDLLLSNADTVDYYVISIGETADYINTIATYSTASSTATITQLEENTEYQMYVGSVCLNGDTSSIVGPISFTTLFLNDVGIAEVTGPESACEMGLDVVTFNLTGYGSNLQSLFGFEFSVNGEMVPVPMFEDGFFTGIVGSEDTVSVSFDTEYDFSSPGLYEIAVWTTLDTDNNPTNDTAYYSFYSIPTVDNLPYQANFVDNSEGWSVSAEAENSTWEFGAPDNLIINSANTGENAWVTTLVGPYNNNERSYLESVCFDFSSLDQDPYFSLNINYNTEASYDGCWLEGSTDGGDTWEKIGSVNSGLNWYNNTITNTGNLGDVWSGDSNGWIYTEHLLSGYMGESSCKFRFGFASDGSVSYEGVGIDDINIYIKQENDLLASQAIHTATAPCGSDMDIVEFTFSNIGINEQTDITAYYQVNNETPVMESLDAVTVASGESYTHVFMTPFNSFGLGESFDVKSWVEVAGDQEVSNDTTVISFMNASPEPIPVVEDFESGLLLSGWTTDGTIGMAHNSVTSVLYRNMYSAFPTFTTTTANYQLDDQVQNMTFDYRFANYLEGTVGTVLAGDSLIVEIAMACENDYTPLLVIDETNHDSTAEFTSQMVDLTPYAGQMVSFRFRGVWAAGDYFLDLDNININTDAVSTEEIEELVEYNLYPNPTTANTRLEASFDQPVDVHILVANALGQTVYVNQIDRTTAITEDIQTSNWAAGIYFVNMNVDGKNYTQRLIKQ